MGKPKDKKDKKKGSIKTYDQPVEKKEDVQQEKGIAYDSSESYEKSPEMLNDLITRAKELLHGPWPEHADDDANPAVIAKKTLERFIDRLKAI